jgi:fructose-1,6-bisphosphatase/inositol monophosphatase family enzyme
MDGRTAAELRDPIAAVLRNAAAEAILPRFRQLRRADVSEKSPGEWVTVADRDSEQILADGLRAFLPDARVVGEEACSADASLLDGIDKDLVWIVDPLDGTANFASGHGPFGIIVALAEHGETLASWLYDPLKDRLCFAAQRSGAHLLLADESPVRLRAHCDSKHPIATLATQFMPAELREAMVSAAQSAFEVRPIPRCAAEHYPQLCLGESHVALFQRTLPWDHAAGALLLTEAGGHIARWNGEPYRFHDDRVGILAASSRELWDRAADALLADSALHAQGDRLVAASVAIPGLRE